MADRQLRVLYLLPILPPRLPAAEALSQEIAALRQRFDGGLIYINPNRRNPGIVPRLLFGFHLLPRIWAQETAVDLCHFYNPDPFPFPLLRFLRRPVVYSISSGVGQKRPNVGYFSRLTAVTVADERSFNQLQAWGLTNVHLARSGIDLSRFTHTPIPLEDELRLMVASAPWTAAQFGAKGIDALLVAAQQMPRLRLLFLWRGMLADEMAQRVRAAGLEERVEVINRRVDVNQVLATVHATVNLAADAAIIKAYPHSLLDSLAAGKPVIVSRAIPISEYVTKTGCGLVVEAVTPEHIIAAIKKLVDDYQALKTNALLAGQRDFSEEAMVESFRRVYESALDARLL